MRKQLIYATMLALCSFGTVSCSDEEETEAVVKTEISKKNGIYVVLSTSEDSSKIIYTLIDSVYKNNTVVSVRKFVDTLPLLGDTVVDNATKQKKYNFYVTVK